MKVFLSVILRGSYLLAVVVVALGMAIAVGMGFDAGISVGASLVALLYLAVFLPAVLLGFLPLKTIQHPPIALKIWYRFMAALMSLWIVAGIIQLGISIYDGTKSSMTSSNICVANSSPEKAVWIEWYWNSLTRPEWQRVPGWHLNPIQPLQRKCVRTGGKLSIDFRAYTASSEYSIPTDEPNNKPYRIVTKPGSDTCIEVSPLKQESPSSPLWGISEISCPAWRLFSF